ncbi:unnamed protein product [Brassicogethes aeneus]|uniref:Uncharacterized protein n=1 Tax=Brassicogethes aeneus TaxID=1431903 RepID=A0A9P0FEJ8_BRAAE|nr:unnamed protein product [Brassicogethes aeneus]
MTYKATKFVQLTLPHSESIPIPNRPSPTEEYMPPTFVTAGELSVTEYVPSNVTPNCNHMEITQNRLDIMIRRLKLSQRQSILLAKELKQVNILAPDARIYGSIGRHRRFSNFFKSIENNTLAFCLDIRGLVLTLHHEYKPEDWRLFIDSSKSSLKAVLLHVTNSKNSVPIAISTNTKENYSSLKKIIDLVKYDEHKWKICADLKVVSILTGLQLGYTKNMCFMCLWDTRYAGDQNEKRNWPTRVLNGPDIRRLIKNRLFEDALSDAELVAWNCLKAVIENVLGAHRSKDWRIHIENMLKAFHNIGVSMSLKLHFLHCHIEKFAEQSPAESDEHGERFHQIMFSKTRTLVQRKET